MKILRLPIVLLLILVLLSACSGSNLNGTEWTLSSLSGKEPLGSTAITLMFDQGNVGGSAGCNSYGGSFTGSSSKLSISSLMQTEMACMEDGVMEQESAYLTALSSAASFKVVDDRLEISNAAGDTILTFVRK